MKTLYTLITFLLVMSCSEEKKDMAMEMSDEAKMNQPKAVNLASMNNPILDNYFKIQEELVNDKSENVMTNAAALKTAVEAAEFDNKDFMLASVEELLKAKTITDIRIAFKPLSDHMIAYAENNPVSSNVYLMHCPMAFHNKGADWLQNSEKLYNPYFGSKMLTCGSTKKTIAAKSEM